MSDGEPLFDLDHVGVAVADLEVARATFERLGFTLTPRSIHTGSLRPGGPVEAMGSGNHCAMFEAGYLEVIGITDPRRPNMVAPLLCRYAGAHIVAIGCDDAERAHEVLRERHPGIPAPAVLERPAQFGPDAETTRLARFSNIYPNPKTFDEAKYIIIEHLTRDVLWQPRYLEHPNGATAISEVLLCADDVDDRAARLGRVLGVAPDLTVDGTATLGLERGRIRFLMPAVLAALAPGVSPPAVPCVAGFGVAVRDLDRACQHLKAQGISCQEGPGGAVWVGPEVAMGCVITFFPG